MIPYTPPDHWRARLDRVVDGDTLDLVFDCGWDTLMATVRVRLEGVDTPETYGKRSDFEDKIGDEAAFFVKEWLLEAQGDALSKWPLAVQSKKGGSRGKYGRWLVRVFNIHGECLNDALVAEQSSVEGVPYAVEYKGSGPKWRDLYDQ